MNSSPPETVTCPGCNGKTTVRGLVKKRGRDCVPADVLCPTCEGIGWLSQDHIDRMAAGDKLREERLASRETLAMAAARMGITPAELSRRERGRL